MLVRGVEVLTLKLGVYVMETTRKRQELISKHSSCKCPFCGLFVTTNIKEKQLEVSLRFTSSIWCCLVHIQKVVIFAALRISNLRLILMSK